MSIQAYQQAVASTRAVLAQVNSSQLALQTPCAAWKTTDLINHIVGGQFFFAAATAGRPPAGEAPDFSAGDYLATFDEGAAQAIAEFSTDGALTKMVKLPFGDMPGMAWLGIATSDTFTHGWDLAKTIGVSTDLAPELAGALLGQMTNMIPDTFRGPEGAPFGAAKQAPAGSSKADELAAFLGRAV